MAPDLGMARLVLGRRRPLRPGRVEGQPGRPGTPVAGRGRGSERVRGLGRARAGGEGRWPGPRGGRSRGSPWGGGGPPGTGAALGRSPLRGPSGRKVRGAWGDEGALGGGDFLPSGRSVCASAAGGGSPATGLEPRAPGTAPSVGPSGRCRAPVKGRRWAGRV